MPLRPRPRRVLVVNAGSTSVKVSLVDGGRTVHRFDDLDDALAVVGGTGATPEAVGHRVVHGGDRDAPVVLDDAVVGELRGLVELAPLHQPPALDAVDRCRAALPGVAQVACFDTSFHTTIPAAARAYALPGRLRERVRVYGFHGLSHAWASRRARELVPGARRVLVAHLGGGQSLCGVLDGASVVTTMGFTPLDGLVMATRSGRLDPGAVLWLARHTGEDLDRVLEQESGLLGLCGTGDMREVLARADDGDEAAGFALEVYLHRFTVEAGGCVAALGGLDTLVFTGGAGEGSARLRSLIAQRLAWLGTAVEAPVATAMSGNGEDVEVSAPGARVRTLVVHAREDLQIAGEVEAVLAGD